MVVMLMATGSMSAIPPELWNTAPTVLMVAS